MKTKIEAIASIIVIFVAMVVGSVFLKDRLSSVAPAEADAVAVKIGDKLPDLVGWNWGAQDQTLVMALRKGCHFCEDSVPFYQRLIAQHQENNSNTTILAATRVARRNCPSRSKNQPRIATARRWPTYTNVASVRRNSSSICGSATLLEAACEVG